jgi:hypothetical protein
MAPIIEDFYLHPDNNHIDGFNQTMQVAGIARANTRLHPRIEAGDTSSDQKISTAGVIGLVVAVLLSLALLAWLCYSMRIVEPAKKKERIRRRRRRRREIKRNAPGVGNAAVVNSPAA